MKFVMLFILFVTTTALARATDRLIAYEDFIHLSFAKQVEAVEMVHDYLTEYNNQYLLNTIPTKKKIKYQSYLKILNFFLASSYAEEKSFDSIPGNIKCYYGGWISFMIRGY